MYTCHPVVKMHGIACIACVKDTSSCIRRVGSAMSTATFNLFRPTRVRLYRNFGTVKDGSLLIHSLASFSCFTYKNLFQTGTNDMAKMLYIINDCLAKKLNTLCCVDHPILFKFHQLVAKIFLKELQIVF